MLTKLGLRRTASRLLLMMSGVVALSGFAAAEEKSVLGRAVAVSEQVSMDRISHDTWDGLLQKYVDEKGRVDYRSWTASAADKQALDSYLRQLSAASRNLPAKRQSQLAFWINAYNAVTVKGILREYPTSSIRNHTAKIVGYNIWHDLLLTVGNTQVSLDTIEHKILRKMNEPRIHFAIVCASKSCPRLLNQSYTSDKLATQLTKNAENFFSDSANFQYDAQTNRFRLTSILKWFGEDFGANQPARLKAISAYLPTDAARSAANSGTVRVSFVKFDWGLNEQQTAREPALR